MARKGTFTASATIDGQRIWAYGKSPEEAKTNLEVKKALYNANASKVTGNATVKEWCYEWLKSYKGDIEGSAWHGEIERLIRLKIVPSIGYMKVRSVKPIHIANMYNEYTDCSQSLGSKLVQITKNIFEMAEENDLIARNPARNVKSPKFAKKVGHRAITEEERALIVTTAKKHLDKGLFFLIMLYCGLRPGEVCALKAGDYDSSRRIISVKRARKADGTIGSPKSDAGIREVPVPKVLAEILDGIKKSPEEFLVTSTQGRPLTKTSRKRMWYQFKDLMDIESGVPTKYGRPVYTTIADDLDPYTLRHSYATDLQAAGVELGVAKDLLGHSDIRISSNLYIHRSDAALENARKKINEFHK